MNLSHQKLSLSRDMENVSSAYQEALNTTKLVYDYEGLGTSQIDLSYGLLMSPSAYNDYYPKTVTDSKNRVILNSAYADAAKAAGIPAEGLSGTPSSDVRNSFIKALASNNVISPYTSASIQSVAYGNTVGLGSTISATTSYDEVSYDDLLELLKTTEAISSYSDIDLGQNTKQYTTSKEKDGTAYETIRCNGIVTNHADDASSGVASFTLADLLTDEYTLYYRSDKSEQTPVYEAWEIQSRLTEEGGVLDFILDQFSSVLGGVSSNDLALQYAYNQVFDLLYPNSNLKYIAENLDGGVGGTDLDEHSEWKDSVDGVSISATMNEVGTRVYTTDSEKHNGGSWVNVGAKAENYLGLVFSGKNKDNGDDGDDYSAVAVSLSNIAKAFLTSYVEYCQGVDVSSYTWDMGSISDCLLYKSSDDFTFTVVSDTAIDNGDSDLNASFYDALFNQICTQGWVENDQIDDNDYLAEMLKNGMAYISSLSDDGYYYQSTYSNDKFVLEVSDDEAIARAEAQYNTEKTKIENKEDTLDLKIKNLDTEISSLNQEYETVKSLVTKSIEKSFKRYEA
jgi:hypothetical protein